MIARTHDVAAASTLSNHDRQVRRKMYRIATVARTLSGDLHDLLC